MVSFNQSYLSKGSKITEGIMAIELRIKTKVLPGGKIEISVPELIAGQEATIVVTVEDYKLNGQGHVIDLLKNLPGHQLFHTAEEIDPT
jgi:hypothetical protein